MTAAVIDLEDEMPTALKVVSAPRAPCQGKGKPCAKKARARKGAEVSLTDKPRAKKARARKEAEVPPKTGAELRAAVLAQGTAVFYEIFSGAVGIAAVGVEIL